MVPRPSRSCGPVNTYANKEDKMQDGLTMCT